MGCCGGKLDCKKSAEMQPVTTPAAEFHGAGLYTLGMFLDGLKEITAAGLQAGNIFRRLNLQHEGLTRLAKQIADLAIENAYFKSVLNMFSPADFNVEDSTLEINFGPQHTYRLQLPVTSRNSRREIAKQLRAAADKLEAELLKPARAKNPAQRLFSFFNAE